MRQPHTQHLLLIATAMLLTALPACQTIRTDPGLDAELKRLRAENEQLRALAEGLTATAEQPTRRGLTLSQNGVMDNLQTICAAAHQHARAEGRMPESIDELLDHYLPPAKVNASDGEPFWLDFAPMDTFDSFRIVGYDRGAVARSEYAAVLFADCHVELLAPLRFRRLTEEPPNAGVDFDLPPLF